MAIEIGNGNTYCYMCGTAYSQKKGYFPVSYAKQHKGIGYMPVCRSCVEKIYNEYLEKSGDERIAVRQVCRKFDLYWSESVLTIASKKSAAKTLISQYIAKLATNRYAGKCYDDTLSETDSVASFNEEGVPTQDQADDTAEIPKEYIEYWGAGYTLDAYEDLERRKRNWISGLPDGNELDVSTEAIIKQICCLEVDINKNRMIGKSVDKLIYSYNSLLGSANLKPTQRKQDDDSGLSETPLGVWLYMYENERPLPEISDDCKDVNGLRKYMFTWMGHLCKMLGLKNGYEQMYQDEIDRLRVEKPEYDEEDDEEFMAEVMAEEADEQV